MLGWFTFIRDSLSLIVKQNNLVIEQNNLLLEQNEEIIRLLEALVPSSPLPVALAIDQTLQGDSRMITGVQVGGSGTFQESFVPSNAALPPGATLSVTWTVDDKLVTLAPSADGTSVVATVDPSDTATSFNLTATGSSAALPASITGTVNVPILPVPPPLPTALAINQTA